MLHVVNDKSRPGTSVPHGFRLTSAASQSKLPILLICPPVPGKVPGKAALPHKNLTRMRGMRVKAPGIPWGKRAPSANSYAANSTQKTTRNTRRFSKTARHYGAAGVEKIPGKVYG